MLPNFLTPEVQPEIMIKKVRFEPGNVTFFAPIKVTPRIPGTEPFSFNFIVHYLDYDQAMVQVMPIGPESDSSTHLTFDQWSIIMNYQKLFVEHISAVRAQHLLALPDLKIVR